MAKSPLRIRVDIEQVSKLQIESAGGGYPRQEIKQCSILEPLMTNHVVLHTDPKFASVDFSLPACTGWTPHDPPAFSTSRHTSRTSSCCHLAHTGRRPFEKF